MQVILQENIPDLGKVGDIVKVKDGYARNYLLPKKKAVLADPRNMRQLEHQKRLVAAKQLKLKSQAEELAKKLGAITITISRDTADEEKLFGSVTTKDIADALRKEGVSVDRHDLNMDSPIKNIGVYDVPVKLHPEVTGTIKVWVVKK
ncbi:MAG: 50S ribosomal protein L9 [Pseudomonadota bacterium]